VADDDNERIGVRWLVRETLFVVLGMALWAAFGWRVLWGLMPVALVLNLVMLRRRTKARTNSG
jgi:hypothetical protein